MSKEQSFTPPGDGCAQTSDEDLLKGCLEHYDRVSTIACEWNNQVPQAIRAWYAAKSRPSAKPIERCANGEPCGNTETGWCWGRCMKEYAFAHSETAAPVVQSATLGRSYQPGDRVIVANPSGHIEEGTVEDAIMVKLDYDGSIHEYTHNQVSRINATDSRTVPE